MTNIVANTESSPKSPTATLVSDNRPESLFSIESMRSGPDDLCKEALSDAKELFDAMSEDIADAKAHADTRRLYDIAAEADDLREEFRQARLRKTRSLNKRVRTLSAPYNHQESKYASLVESTFAAISYVLRTRVATNPEFETEWQVRKVSEEEVDLKPLRPHFSEAVLKAAASKHLAATNRTDVKGVDYREVPIL